MQTHLIVVSEVIVGNGDRSGPHHSIDEPISAVGERVVIDPNVARPED